MYPVVKRTRAWEMSEQILHLVGEHAPPLEENILGIGRRERNGQQLHLRLLGRERGLLIVTTATGGYDIGPNIDAALAERPDVIPRQFACWKTHATIHAQKRVAPEECLIVQRWNIVVPRVARIARMSNCRNNRVDFEDRAQSTRSVDPTVEFVECRT